MEEKKGKRGGWRGGGRPKSEGSRHLYTVADDAHEWIMMHGAGKYITETVRKIMKEQGGTSL